jgi:phosphoenolpyruvate---glycerone phosphotransferase subunit DhaL
MDDSLTLDDLIAILLRIRAQIERNQDWLCELDSLGDADHGVSMTIAVRAIEKGLAATPPAHIGAALGLAARVFISEVGGAIGPLYGTAFLRASSVAGTATAVSAAQVAGMFEAACRGVAERGKAAPGDKTLLDALGPAAEAATAAVAAQCSLCDTLERAAEAAEAGAAATATLIARKGRAGMLGERSRGHQDAGATSTALMIRAAADVLRERRGR